MAGKKIAFDIEDLEISVKVLRSLSLAISQAIMNGAFTVSSYEWGFYGIDKLINELLEDIVELKDEAFEELRKGELK